MQDQPIDTGYLCQTNDDVFDIAQHAVNFAVAVITQSADSLSQDVEERALELLGRYGDIHKMTGLPPLFQAKLLIRNYGEEEFEAMGEAGEVPAPVWKSYLESKGKK